MLKPIFHSRAMGERITAKANKPALPFLPKSGSPKQVTDIELLVDFKGSQVRGVTGHYQVNGDTKAVGRRLNFHLTKDYVNANRTMGQPQIKFKTYVVPHAPPAPPTGRKPVVGSRALAPWNNDANAFMNPRPAPKPPGQSDTSASTGPYYSARSSVYTPRSTSFDLVSDAALTPGAVAAQQPSAAVPPNVPAATPAPLVVRRKPVSSTAAAPAPAHIPSPLNVIRRKAVAGSTAAQVAVAPRISEVAPALAPIVAEIASFAGDLESRWSKDLLQDAFDNAARTGNDFEVDLFRQTFTDFGNGVLSSVSSPKLSATQKAEARQSVMNALAPEAGLKLGAVASASVAQRPVLLTVPAKSFRGAVAEANWFTASAQSTPGFDDHASYLKGLTPSGPLYSAQSAVASSVVLPAGLSPNLRPPSIAPPVTPPSGKVVGLTRGDTLSNVGKRKYRLGRLKADGDTVSRTGTLRGLFRRFKAD